MLNAFKKLGNKRKGDPNEAAVTVNHASRAAGHPTSTVNPQSQPAASSSTAAPPPAPPAIAVIEVLPSLRDVSSSERPNLVIRKLQLCCFMCDFSDSLKMVREKEIKRQTLLELLDYIQTSSGKMIEATHQNLIRMVSINLFRSLPPNAQETTGSLSDVIDPEEEEPFMEPSWSHMQLVYELLVRYVVSNETNSRIAKRYLDHTFVLKILDLFDSEDPREREYLKTVVHRIYSRFMGHRPFIRYAINNILFGFIFETERHSGVPELLEILGSIINGLAVPMKQEHKLFLVRAVIPLHRPKSASLYHQQLSYCMTQFVEKDYELADTVVRGLLKYWPVTNCQREVMFLGELEEVLDLTQGTEFQQCMVPLFKQIARCINSPHFQVAERALYLWNNDHVVSLIVQNRNVILPIIFRALENNIQGHWKQDISGLSQNVQKMFLEMDADLFDECQKHYMEQEAKVEEREEQRELKWKKLEESAKAGSEDAES